MDFESATANVSGHSVPSDSQASAQVKPLLLVIGSGDKLYRGYILKFVAQHYRLWLLQPAPVTWQEPYIVGSTIVDNTRIDLTIAAARTLSDQLDVAGIFCYDEGLVLIAAHVADALGLVSMTATAVHACRDKHATRTTLAAAGVAQAQSICVASYAEARAAADQIGYPVVLKPRGLSGSKGVIRVDDVADLEQGFHAARGASYPGVPVYDAGVLVEEYLDGPEISIDSVSINGQLTPVILARKQVAFEPFFEEIGHVVSANDPLLHDPQIRALLEQCITALGVRNGVTHTEIRLTARGPRLIEVNARLGGDLIPYLGWLATGINMPLAAADIAANRTPQLEARHARVAAIRFLYPAEDCQVDAIDVSQAALPSETHLVVVTAQPGAELRLPPRGYLARYGYMITVGDSAEACLRALEATQPVLTLHAHPLEVAEVLL